MRTFKPAIARLSSYRIKPCTVTAAAAYGGASIDEHLALGMFESLIRQGQDLQSQTGSEWLRASATSDGASAAKAESAT
jgi:hypothetical protein